VKLVLQCAMCGTHHPVGTVACSTCRATGVAQLRLMFECQSCGRLDLSPTCDTCPRPANTHAIVFDLADDLIIAEEVSDDALGATDESDDFPLEIDIEYDEVEKLVVDLSAYAEDGEGSSLDDPGSEVFEVDYEEEEFDENEDDEEDDF
jgi:hypothetical protein